MNYCVIDGERFDVDVAIESYEETLDVLDGENVGRAMSGRMIRDIIGTYLGHKVKFFNKGGDDGNAEFDRLWDYIKVKSVQDSVMLSGADGQTTIEYEAYFTHAQRKIKEVHGGVNYWDDLEINFIPMEAQITP